MPIAVIVADASRARILATRETRVSCTNSKIWCTRRVGCANRNWSRMERAAATTRVAMACIRWDMKRRHMTDRPRYLQKS